MCIDPPTRNADAAQCEALSRSPDSDTGHATHDRSDCDSPDPDVTAENLRCTRTSELGPDSRSAALPPQCP